MTTLASLEDLSTLLGRTFDTPAEEEQALLWLRAASNAVRNFAKQDFTLVEDDTVTIPGVWGAWLELPQRPVLSVTDITIGDVPVSEFSVVNSRIARGHLLNYDVAWIGWGGPTANITVTYTHGYVTIPDDVADVTLAVAARVAVNPQQVRQESLGSYAVTYASETLSSQLSPAEMAQLRKYRRWWN